jgi:thiol:disulfide interchange protein DsbC
MLDNYFAVLIHGDFRRLFIYKGNGIITATHKEIELNFIKLTLLSVLAFPIAAFAGEKEDALLKTLKNKYPATQVVSVNPSPIAGLYEVVMGKNIAYTDDVARFVVFGHVYDMQTQQDMTADRLAQLTRIDWAHLPLANAIKTVKGNGKRQLAVFSDPDCPYCKSLETSLEKLDNVTIYTFLFPLASLHPQSEAKAIAIWCSKNPSSAWHQWMVKAEEPKASVAGCISPIKDNVALGQKLGILGTPTLIAPDGSTKPGAVPIEQIEAWLGK